MVLTGIVLAAGQSSRMGREKAFLPIDGQPLLAQHIALLSRFCSRVIVVVRPELSSLAARASIACAHAECDVLALSTGSPAESLAGAVRALAQGSSAVITPVDLMPPKPETLQQLLAAFERPGVLAATPVHGGRGGHPVVLASELLDAYRSLDGDEAPMLRAVLASAGPRRLRVEVDDPHVLGDFDTPADLPPVTAFAR